jgi:hypothetical protein
MIMALYVSIGARGPRRRTVTPDGEWEAWFFANWNPGANRYRSFREMMQAERANFLRLVADTV